MPFSTTGTVTTTSNVRQLSDRNGENGGPGTQLGASAADLIGFYGAAPVAQPSGGFQALAQALPGGLINSYAPTLTPSAVAANTTAEQTFTVTGLAGTPSLVIVNKPTAQAGLGIAGVRVSAANTLAINYSNDTSGSITPTASEVYQVVELISGDGLTFTATLTPAAVAANVTSEQTFSVPTGNVQVGTALAVNKPTSQAGLGVSSARVSAANTVAITFFNNTAAPITPTAAEVYVFADLNGVSAADNVLVYNINVGNPHAVVFVNDVADAGDLKSAPVVTPTDEYPDGVNVEFVQKLENGELAMRVHERGVGETRSCGTGTCAVALAATLDSKGRLPATWIINPPGGRLKVEIDGHNNATLTGPAVLIKDVEVKDVDVVRN